MNKILSTEDIVLLYKRLSTAHNIISQYFTCPSDKYNEFIISVITECVGNLVSQKESEFGELDAEQLKNELTHGMNSCLLNKELTDEFGVLYLAEDDNLVVILEKIGEKMLEQLFLEFMSGMVISDENYKAANN